MAWKQDLAKLKQQLDPERPGPARKVVPKPAAKPSGPTALDDEDAVFLSAMGLKSTQSRSPKTTVGEVPSSAPMAPEPPVPETFQEAVKDLKGLKPLAKDLLEQGPPPTSSPHPSPKAAPEVVQRQPSEAVPPEPAASPAIPPPSQPSLPLRFQLAAGMALEVDGILDLRGHSLPDAMERLKDRLGDGVVLGWRTLQVTLGPDPALHEGLLELLTAGQTPMLVRYAQAPVPMGGTQAWLLYFGPSPAQP